MTYRRTDQDGRAPSHRTSRRDHADARPLLPPVMANGVVDAARFTTGAVLLAALAVSWLALASWSPTDPSLSHVTTTDARNLLGWPGAVVADVLIESLGLASLALLLPPFFWGLALVQCEPLPRIVAKVMAQLSGVLCAAIALGALPQPVRWPAYHGLGGVAGEALSRLLLSQFATAPPDVVRFGLSAVAGISSVVLLLAALGRASAPSQTVTTRRRAGVTSGRGLFTATPAAPVRQAIDSASDHDLRAEPQLAPLAPSASPFGPDWGEEPQPPVSRKAVERFGRYADFEPDPEPIDDPFDAWTEAASSHIAARFAPKADGAGGPQALQDTISLAFGGAVSISDREVIPAHWGDDTFGVMPIEAASAAPRTASSNRSGSYKRPSLNLLERPRGKRSNQGYAASLLRGNARLLEDVLAEFGVIGHVAAITPGPVVARYDVETRPGTRLDRVVALSDDIARGMRVASVRVAAIAGRQAFSVELPNDARETIVLRDILDAEAYRCTMDHLPLALGVSASGEPVVGDLTQMSHLLVAGDAGSGKSTGLNAMILSLIYKHGPENCRFLMIDQRMVELARYDGIPHLLTPVVSDPHKAVTALAWCVHEMEERIKRMAALGVRSIELFNNRVRNAKKRGERLARTVQTGFDERTGKARFEQEDMSLEPMAYIVIVIDEFADLMAVAGREIEGAVQRLAQAARTAGIHLIMASERAALDVMTPGIKGSLPTRISYRLAARRDSRAVLGSEGAEQLLGAGDMLYATGPGAATRVHGPHVSNEEVDTVTDSLRRQAGPEYIAALAAARSADGQGRGATRDTGPKSRADSGVQAASEDALFDRAVAIVARERHANAALLQQRLAISPGWAAAIAERLEAAGIIGPCGPSGVHQVLIGAAA